MTGPKAPAKVSSPAEKAGKDVVFILGAGVDKALGLPLLNTIFRDLNLFVRGAGKPIHAAIRSHVKGLRFDLQTYDSDQGERLGQKLLGSHSHLLPLIQQALGRHPDQDNANVLAIQVVINKLQKIANENELEQSTVAQLSQLAGEQDAGIGDTLLDPEHMAFRPVTRQAIKTLFATVHSDIPNLSGEEREAFAEVIALLSNFEELLGSLFAGYFTKHLMDQKRYFYLAWLLWAYIRHREEAGRQYRPQSFYKTLSDVGAGGGIITFNYTDFFCNATRPKDGYFHGDVKAYLRFDTREYIANDVQAKDARTIERMATFIESLPVDWTKEIPKVFLPAIVPPLSVKPIISTEYLDRWYICSQTIRAAQQIVIVGYSFGAADEHFNDLIRKGNPAAKLLIIDPGMDTVVANVCRVVGQDRTTLAASVSDGLDCLTGGRLSFLKAKAEEITAPRLLAHLH